MTPEHDPDRPNATFAMFFKVKGNIDDEDRDIIEKYLNRFYLPPLEDGDGFAMGHPCVNCGEPTAGMLGCGRWGIAHGEWTCGNCDWPGRGMHYIKDSAGKDLITVRNYFLQYHGDHVEFREALEG